MSEQDINVLRDSQRSDKKFHKNILNIYRKSIVKKWQYPFNITLDIHKYYKYSKNLIIHFKYLSLLRWWIANGEGKLWIKVSSVGIIFLTPGRRWNTQNAFLLFKIYWEIIIFDNPEIFLRLKSLKYVMISKSVRTEVEFTMTGINNEWNHN